MGMKRMIYRIAKLLNHNSFIGIESGAKQECLIMGKGIAFGKKIGQTIEVPQDARIYSLKELTDRGDAREIINSVSPVCLELANEILREAEAEFGDIDRSILFPIADHLDFAIRRLQRGEQISNPLTDDIRVLFHNEFQVASVLRDILQKRMQITIDEHEIGYVALHIHSAIEDEKVSVAMQTARAVRECIEMIEKETGEKIDVISLSYNRLMNHIKYMVARALTGEDLRINMNDYIESKFPEAYMTAKKVCDMLGKSIGKELDEIEIGYLAMHIERIYREEIKA